MQVQNFTILGCRYVFAIHSLVFTFYWKIWALITLGQTKTKFLVPSKTAKCEYCSKIFLILKQIFWVWNKLWSYLQIVLEAISNEYPNCGDGVSKLLLKCTSVDILRKLWRNYYPYLLPVNICSRSPRWFVIHGFLTKLKNNMRWIEKAAHSRTLYVPEWVFC